MITSVTERATKRTGATGRTGKRTTLTGEPRWRIQYERISGEGRSYGRSLCLTYPDDLVNCSWMCTEPQLVPPLFFLSFFFTWSAVGPISCPRPRVERVGKRPMQLPVGRLVFFRSSLVRCPIWRHLVHAGSTTVLQIATSCTGLANVVPRDLVRKVGAGKEHATTLNKLKWGPVTVACRKRERRNTKKKKSANLKRTLFILVILQCLPPVASWVSLGSWNHALMFVKRPRRKGLPIAPWQREG